MNTQKRSYSQFSILDLLCMSIGFFLGIFIRHGNFEYGNGDGNGGVEYRRCNEWVENL